MSAPGGFAGRCYGVEAEGLASIMPLADGLASIMPLADGLASIMPLADGLASIIPLADGLGTAAGDVHAANARLARRATQATHAC